jgi:hypothetical protein
LGFSLPEIFDLISVFLRLVCMGSHVLAILTLDGSDFVFPEFMMNFVGFKFLRHVLLFIFLYKFVLLAQALLHTFELAVFLLFDIIQVPFDSLNLLQLE